jgi:hypothetical protein
MIIGVLLDYQLLGCLTILQGLTKVAANNNR